MVAATPLPDELQVQAARIVSALAQEAARYPGAAGLPQLSELTFTRVTDPGNQLPGYEGRWLNAAAERCGCLSFNSDGSFYAEYDLFCPHPTDARHFIEMVTAWGRADLLRVEVQMIPGLENA